MSMKRLLTTPDREAYLDFLMVIVVLEMYESNHLADFQRAIAWEPGQPIDARTSDLRALLKHEVTHFLDMTTTAWGGQYTMRKLQLLRKLQSGGSECEDADKVFALETGELEVHANLVQSGPWPTSFCDAIAHELIYREEYGVVLMVEYQKNGMYCHKVPVSMLSLLEANATASEYLSLIQCAQSQQDVVEKRLGMEELYRRYEALLDDPARLEYSSLLHLTRVHFSWLSLAQQLELVAAIARFSLDASPFTIGPIANHIQRSFKKMEYGDAISMELRRDSYRHLIFFKTVLFMYGWLHNMRISRRPKVEALVRSRPMRAIKHLWNHLESGRFEDDFAIRGLVSATQEQMMRDLDVALADSQVFGECSRSNRALLETTSAGLLSFRDMKLMNALLADNGEVVFPNRVEINVTDYANDKMDEFVKLDKAYREMTHERFHLAPGSPDVYRVDR